MMRLPSIEAADDLMRGLAARTPWFYQFHFTNGAATNAEYADVASVHESRAAAIFPHLHRLFGDDWHGLSALDIACHEGWFAFQTALRGVSVTALDIRPEHIAKARWIAAQCEPLPLSFAVRDLFTLTPDDPGIYDLVWFIGICYHLENPMGALRIARSLTRRVCVIEGQVARDGTMTIESGAQGTGILTTPGAAVIAANPVHAHDSGSVSIVPSLSALTRMCYAAGFSDVHLVMASPTSDLLFQAMDRVILFAYP